MHLACRDGDDRLSRDSASRYTTMAATHHTYTIDSLMEHLLMIKTEYGKDSGNIPVVIPIDFSRNVLPVYGNVNLAQLCSLVRTTSGPLVPLPEDVESPCTEKVLILDST